METEPMRRPAVTAMLAAIVLLTLGSSPRTFAIEPVVDAVGVETTAADTDAAAAVDELDPGAGDGKTDLLAEIEERPEEPPPFDFSPYRVLIWIASDDPRIDAESLQVDLMKYLD